MTAEIECWAASSRAAARFACSTFRWPDDEPLVLGHASSRQHDLADAYRLWLAERPDQLEPIVAERPDGPLAVTHRRGRKDVPCRYDQIWVSPEWGVESVLHLTDESFEAGSDHAMVVAELAYD